MTRLDRISAVVCNYNGEHYLPECLASIQAQGEALDEILVVDNGSTDRSVEIVREGFPDVSVIELGRNAGPCTARNEGMRAARNRWVLAIDNDAVLRPDVLGRLRVALEQHPGAVAAQTRNVFASDEGRVHYDGARFHYAGLLSLRNFYRPLAEAEGEGTLAVDGLIAITVLLDRDAVLALGGYDDRFFILFDDFDLALRLRIAGHVLLSVEDAIVLHRGGTPGISFRGGDYPRSRAFLHSRNRWLLLAKSYRLRTLLACLPGIAVYEVVWGLFALRQGHLGAHLAGKLAFGRALPDLLRRRREVQRSRRVADRDLLVGGPLTFSPEVLGSGLARGLARVLDAVLAGWWRVARWLCG